MCGCRAISVRFLSPVLYVPRLFVANSPSPVRQEAPVTLRLEFAMRSHRSFPVPTLVAKDRGKRTIKEGNIDADMSVG